MAGLKYWVWLSELRGLSNRTKLQLLDHFGAPENIYYADEAEFELLEDLPDKLPQINRDTADADRILGDCQRLAVRIVTMQDADYPIRLRNIFDPPLLLYVKGSLPALDEEVAVAVVGTRSATPYGIESAETLAFSLARQGALIVSGAARGIDAAAHRGALRAGRATVAVLGCGVDVVYPPENERLYADIAATGALVSIYPPGTEALGGHFPVRNRILSGISLATLVVEAPEKSGALITASLALEQGRDVFAVPGPINAPNSRGCNRLIAEGAGLVCESWDILREYAAQYPHKLTAEPVELPQHLGEARQVPQAPVPEEKTPPSRKTLVLSPDILTDDQMILLRTLQSGERQSDDLIAETGIPTRRVLSALTRLEIEGFVRQDSGKRFALNVNIKEE